MSVKDAGKKSPRLDNFQTWMKFVYRHLWDCRAARKGLDASLRICAGFSGAAGS